MATWQDIGVENFRAAVEAYDRGRYRTAASRFYYAVFSVLTHELLRRHAEGDFGDGRDTPGHGQLPRLIEAHSTHFSAEKTLNLVRYVRSSYRSRIAADYSRLRVDRRSAHDSYTTAKKIFDYLEVRL